MDNAITKMEKALYYIRNCAENASSIEKAIEQLRDELNNLENALEIEMNL
jgi:hypothetical protein